MTLIDVLRLLRRSWKLIVLCTLLGGFAAAGWTMLQPTVYSASSTGYLIAASTSGNSYDAQAAQTYAAQRVQQYLPLASTKVVQEEMATILADDPSGATPGPLNVAIVSGSNILNVRATGPTAAAAQARANAGVRAMAIVIQKMETLNPSVAQANEAGNLEDLSTGGQPSVALVNFEPAALPSAPSSPDWTKNLAMGLAAGLLLGCFVALALKYLDTRVRTSQDMEQLTDASVLGVIPQTSELGKQRKSAEKQGEAGMAAEALRKLRTNLRFVSLDDPARSIVVTSANPGEGKSTVAANLARVLAESGQSVVLIDCDLRKPIQAKAFHLDGRLGLTQVLTGDVSVEDALQATEYSNLQVLTAGRIPPNPSEIAGSQHIADLIQRLSQHHVVIIDAPPLLPVTDAGLLSVAADGAVLVARLGKTYKDQVELAAKMLRQVGGKLLGCVLNGATRKNMGEAVYGYGKGYGYGSTYYYSYEHGKKRRKKKDRAEDHAEAVEAAHRFQPYQPKRSASAAQDVPAAPARAARVTDGTDEAGPA